MSEQIHIEDESGDKKYFTIIPNYILNHSTLYDREVWLQMKRIAGENGTCWMSRIALAKQCGISPRRLDQSLKYLLEHTWITCKGTKDVVTNGGRQKVKEYSIADLWSLNNQYYETKGVAPGAGGASDATKGVAPGAHKEEPYREEEPSTTNVVEALPQRRYGDPEINELFDYWEETTQIRVSSKKKENRWALARLNKQYGLEKAKRLIALAARAQTERYAPRIANPMDLAEHQDRLLAWLKKTRGGQRGVTV